MMLKMMTQGKGLAGLDTKRPWGVVLMTDGQQNVRRYGFLPVTDLKQLMEVAKGNPKWPRPSSSTATCTRFEPAPKPIYVQQKGNWAVVAADKARTWPTRRPIR